MFLNKCNNFFYTIDLYNVLIIGFDSLELKYEAQRNQLFPIHKPATNFIFKELDFRTKGNSV